MTTARLIRGRVYVYKGKKFERGVDTPVSEELADVLEELAVESKDSRDGDVIHKHRFKIIRDGDKKAKAKALDDDFSDDEDEDEVDEPKKPVRRGRKPSRASLSK